MEVKDFINQLCLINFALLVWFKTEAIVEYSKLFKLGKFFRVDKYIDYKKINPEINYITYLTVKNPNFLTKLATCPYCLNFWITLFSCLLFSNIIFFPIHYMISIVVYLILDKYIYGR
jgi:hypothetical protein